MAQGSKKQLCGFSLISKAVRALSSGPFATMIECHGTSDIGLSRLNNEDVFAYLLKERFFILSDGMGGHNSGEVAAQMTVDILCRRVKEAHRLVPTPSRWKDRIRDAICEANQTIYQTSEQHTEHWGMGTTLCLALVCDHKVLIGHVGDSRIYLFRKGRLTRLTQDHSLKGELIACGKLDEDSAKTFSKKNVITRAIGTHLTVHPELQWFDAKSKDLYLLCSDGLSDPLRDSEIARYLNRGTSLKQSTEYLIRAAKKAGGRDNITLLAFAVSF